MSTATTTNQQRKAVPARSSTDKKWRAGSTLGNQNIKKRTRPGSKAAAWTDRAGVAATTTTSKQEPSAVPRKRVREEAKEEKVDEQVEEEAAAIDSDSEEEPAFTEVNSKKKGKRQNRKTGGTGKKQKVFVEEKNDLLNLAASITGQAEEKSKAKLERIKQKPAPPPKDPKKPQISAAKQAQLDAARSIVAQRNKQKKDNKKADAAPQPPKVDDGKKRVSFA
ncbi:hypothetical protein JCM3765_001669 [Sporobolomyces pararoseus]